MREDLFVSTQDLRGLLERVRAREASPTRLPFERLEKLAERIVSSTPEVVSVTYNIASKPPSTIEAV